MANEPEKVPLIQWDTETREELAYRAGHVRDDTMYLSSGLLNWMEDVWGGVLTHVKTSTDVVTGEVSVYRAYAGEAEAVPVRRLGAQNNGEFSFWRPLHKLSLKVPPSRQFNVTPYTKQVEGLGTLFVFPMAERVSVPRNRKAEKAAAEAAAQVTEQAAPTTEEPKE
ncbi:MAG: hypothetical protein ACOY94_03705 [Bacillota bacterium]